jgi:hypothetical protein
VAALVLEPALEAGAGAKGEAVEELVPEAGQGEGFEPGALAEDLDVDERPGGEGQPEGIAAERGVLAEQAAKGGERPAERSERVVRLREEETGQPLAQRGRARPHIARNEGATPVELYATYLDVPAGGAFRIDAADPGNCSF